MSVGGRAILAGWPLARWARALYNTVHDRYGVTSFMLGAASTLHRNGGAPTAAYCMHVCQTLYVSIDKY